MSTYPSFPSIERLENIYCVISEKIDGTNGLIEVSMYDNDPNNPIEKDESPIVRFGSRNRYITFNNDNVGFANFFRHYEPKFIEVAKAVINSDRELSGETHTPILEDYPFRIYGEWFGLGIQRGYDLKDKFFMPFSTFQAEKLIEYQVPNIIQPAILYQGKFSQEVVDSCMVRLAHGGSLVVKDYYPPEGIVIHFSKRNLRLKQTFEGPKWEKAVPKLEHDKKPANIKEARIPCEICGKWLYPNKQTRELQCNNPYCEAFHGKKG